jgi:hypothetical protein
VSTPPLRQSIARRLLGDYTPAEKVDSPVVTLADGEDIRAMKMMERLEP